MNQVLNDICTLVKKCGDFIKNAERNNIQIDEKSGHANFVTEYDKKVQQMLKDGLYKIDPEAHFIGEEGSVNDFSKQGKYFIVDPIDGTTNFIKDYHHSCISVALIKDNIPVLGVVYNPYLDELFYAKKSEGAYLNDKKIKVSSASLKDGLVLFGTSPYNPELSEKSFKMAYEYFTQAMDIRRSGSAALDLCSLACGRGELFFELLLQPWDYAAGGLILTEAGGKITTLDGSSLRYDTHCSVLAKNRD